MSDILKMKGIREVIYRILKAVENKEKIILFGDADPDGVASVIILKEALEILENPPFFIYFPNRRKEGYGLNKKALNFLKDKSPALLIVLDCGIGNFEEIEQANDLGFEVIVIDHHEILGKLPKASIIVDPKQKDDKYAFKELCTAGIVYELVKSLLFEARKKFEPERFLELAMIATLSDQVPQVQENEKILKEGFSSLKYTKRQGLKALMEITGLKDFDQGTIREKIIPLLISAKSKAHSSEAYLLLVEDAPKKSEKIAKLLFKNNKLRKKRIQEILEQAKEKIDPSSSIVFLGAETWPITLVGSIASRICHQHQKPTFIFEKGKKQSQGSVRTPKGINSVEMMAACSVLLETYGGHAQASGFRTKNKNLEEFKKCLIENYEKDNNLR